MAHTALDMFMVKLRSLVYESNSYMSIRNNRYIEAKKPEIHLLNEELGYLIRICFKEIKTGEKELEDVRNWKRRLIETADEAEHMVDMFVSCAIIKKKLKRKSRQRLSFIWKDELFDCSLKDLKVVMGKLKSIREEMSSCIERGNSVRDHLVMQDLMMDNKYEANGTSFSRNTTENHSATKHEELIVGFDDDALLIIDRLTGQRKKLDIISIVGMGGLGKTTLATKIFNDSLVEYHFDMRGWVTVSQAYSKRGLLLQLLASIGKSVDPEAVSESKLCEMLYQSLKRKKYLIVVDDIWSCKAWDDVGQCFPDDNIGSRVLVTTRLAELAWHASQGGFTHNLGHLTEERSWELLCRKTFKGYECPESLTETGKRIAEKCGGLPLAIVVIAGVLEKGEKTKDLWEKIAERVGSYIINDPKGCLDTLALSYDHLPSHLKRCFLYVGGFPEDYNIQVQTLIRLWMAEGLVKEPEQRSFEEEGEFYLMDLIDRNLLMITAKRADGGIKSCRLHDLLREVCLKKADEENFFKKTSMPMSTRNLYLYYTSSTVMQPRLFTDDQVLHAIYAQSSISERSVPSFFLLRALDLRSVPICTFSNINMLVHLRYLAIWKQNNSVLSLPELWSIQTFIVKGKFEFCMRSTYNMLNLRHLRCDQINIAFDDQINIAFDFEFCNVQTVSRITLDHRTAFFLKSFPNIKKLGCLISSTLGDLSFAVLTHLEALNIYKYKHESLTLARPIRFPETLKKLTLKGLCLPWNYMSTIQQLPKLEVLKLLDSSFKGHLWETGDEQFHELKFLKLEKLDIRVWEASSINFPRLRKLAVRGCEDLKEIPLELGNSYTLEHIETDYSNSRVLESVNRIQEAQREIGNYDIHVSFIHMDTTSKVFFQGNPFFD